MKNSISANKRDGRPRLRWSEEAQETLNGSISTTGRGKREE